LPLREVIIEHEIAISLERSLYLLGKGTPLVTGWLPVIVRGNAGLCRFCDPMSWKGI
jgi:hypothetical protein